ncbi:MAG: hypothetical protein WAL77_03085 [Candidatus Dormiibacterota bacterium]
MTFKDFCIVVSFTLFLVAGVVELTTNAVLSRTAVALALFAIAFYVLSRIGPISLPTARGPQPPV